MLVALVAAAVCGAASASLPPLVGVAVASLDGGGDQALVHLDPSTGAHVVTHKLAAEVRSGTLVWGRVWGGEWGLGEVFVCMCMCTCGWGC